MSLLLVPSLTVYAATPTFSPPMGSIDAIYALLERVMPGSSAHFELSLGLPHASDGSGGQDTPAFFALTDSSAGKVAIAASGASELASGIGYYWREYCNVTVGWPRGGGSRGVDKLPPSWPAVGTPLLKRRAVPISHIMNVCTHSYSLVWYSWAEWEAFLDWWL